MKKLALLLSIFALFVTVATLRCEAVARSNVVEISEYLLPKTPEISPTMQVKYKVPNAHPKNQAAKPEMAKEKKCPKNKCIVNDYAEPPAPTPAYVPLDPDIEAYDAVKGGKCCEECACNPACDCGKTCTCSKKHKCSKDCNCNKAVCKCEKNCKCTDKKCKCDKTACKCKKCQKLPEPVEAVLDPESTPNNEVIDIIEVPSEE